MKKRLIISIAISVVVGIVFFGFQYFINIENIRERAEQIDQHNMEISLVEEDVERIIRNNTVWRQNALYTKEMQKQEFSQLLEASVIFRQAQGVSTKIDMHNDENLCAYIESTPLYRGDRVRSQIVMIYDYDYSLKTRIPKLYEKEEFIKAQKTNMMVNAIIVGLVTACCCLITVTLVTVIKKKKKK